MKAKIFVRFRKSGFHQWLQAPRRREYLAYRHRHLFHVEVACHVDHDDREIEFHDLLDFAEQNIEIGGPRSCEHMARKLMEKLVAEYNRPFEVTVSEDGECGATVSQI